MFRLIFNFWLINRSNFSIQLELIDTIELINVQNFYNFIKSYVSRISVESQFPPSAVNNAIENCIEDLEQYLLSLNHSDFKIHVSALRSAKVIIHNKDLNLLHSERLIKTKIPPLSSIRMFYVRLSYFWEKVSPAGLWH